mmetsp:Transcript_10194/g.15370  ORF Transcript_10194/g.15370 Transcript_10194/m.15370 type:complete len:685 (-) Transcript_10194:232-2286(-)
MDNTRHLIHKLDKTVFAAIVLYRICNALLLRTQFDPDEYWQTLEPAYCRAFSSSAEHEHEHEHEMGNCALTWEWTRRISPQEDDPITNIKWIDDAFYGPVRSYLPILPTYILYKLLRVCHWDTTWMVAKAPLLLNAIIVAAPTDMSVYCITRWMYSNSRNDNDHAKRQSSSYFERIETWALLASITNWFNGYALVRTYSNSLETMLLTVGITILCPELFGAISIQDTSTKNNSNSIRPMAKLAFALGGMSVVVRFTALAAWVPLGLLICCRRQNVRSKVYYLVNLCAIPGAIGVFIGCLVDRIFFGFWAIPFLASIHFNVLLGNGALYGTHPFLWYFFAGLPAIAGVLTPFIVYEVVSAFRRRPSRISPNCTSKNENPARLLSIIILSYVIFHSISAHKEFRFILPILPLVCVLAGSTMHTIYQKSGASFVRSSSKRRRNYLLLSLCILNYPHLIYLSVVHQRAPIEVNERISSFLSELIQKNNGSKGDIESSDSKYSVHYLMGCHSTPLYSHLHIPSKDDKKAAVNVETWHLDCSPECRSKSTLCESTQFELDPFAFITSSYGLAGGGQVCSNSREDIEVCAKNERHDDMKPLPDIMAIYESDLNRGFNLESVLVQNGMKIVGRCRHGIKGVQISRPKLGDKKQVSRGGVFSDAQIPSVEVEFDFMIIFSSLELPSLQKQSLI